MPNINSGDSSFVIFATALVLLMTPGLAFFYGGMVRRKNAVDTIFQSFIAIALISVQWVVLGYSLAFGTDIGHFIGGLNFLGLKGVGYAANSNYASNIPQSLFMLFQMMFAIITPALISGAVAERIKFSSYMVFILAWATLVYDPIAHWVWGAGGWLKNLGALDFAGGTVVHISSGVSALVLCIMLGKRKHTDDAKAHSIPMIALGTALLWFGWFGFNAGSALAMNGVALNAFLTTNTSAAAAGIAWILCERLTHRKPTLSGFLGASVAGLVAITPACGYVTPMVAILIGFIGGCVCYFAIKFIKVKFGYDDALDTFGCHGIGGTWGAIATGLFATISINKGGANGLFYGNAKLLGVQALGIIAVYAYSIVVTFIIAKVIDVTMGLRVKEKEEIIGLDVSLHDEDAYEELDNAENKNEKLTA